MAKLLSHYINNNSDNDDYYSSIYSLCNKKKYSKEDKPKLYVTHELSSLVNQYLYKNNNGNVFYFQSPYHIKHIKYIWASREKHELDIIKKNGKLYIKTFLSLHKSYLCGTDDNNVSLLRPNVACTNSRIAVYYDSEQRVGDILTDDAQIISSLELNRRYNRLQNNTLTKIPKGSGLDNALKFQNCNKNNHAAIHANIVSTFSTNEGLTLEQKLKILELLDQFAHLKVCLEVDNIAYNYDQTARNSDSPVVIINGITQNAPMNDSDLPGVDPNIDPILFPVSESDLDFNTWIHLNGSELYFNNRMSKHTEEQL